MSLSRATRPPRPVGPWKPSYGKTKICVSCRSKARAEKKEGPTWRCRGCGVKCCEHTCAEKVDEMAACGACRAAVKGNT